MNQLVRTSAHLLLGVARVPQGIAEDFPSARGGVDHFEGDAGDAEGLGGLLLPVSLTDLLPHHHVEPAAGLVPKHKAGIVVVPVRVHVKRPTEVHCVE